MQDAILWLPQRDGPAALTLRGTSAKTLGVVVKNFDEMEKRAAEIKGKIVLFNGEWVNYGVTNQFRTAGPSRAARVGAIAALVRSVGPMGLRTPHTGSTVYTDDAPKIPAAAIPAEDANRTFEEQVSQIEQRISIVQQGLVRTGVRTVQLGTEEAVELLYKMFNPGEEGKPMPLDSQQ